MKQYTELSLRHLFIQAPPYGPIVWREAEVSATRKSLIFTSCVYFAPPLKGFPLELGTDSRDQKLQSTRRLKQFDDIFIRFDIIPARRVMDRQTDTFQQHRPRYAARRAGNKKLS